MASVSTVILLSLSILCTTSVSAEEETAAICSICECSGDAVSKVVDCADRQLDAIPPAADWPTGDVEIEARFDHNNLIHIKSLGSIPGLRRLSLSHCKVTLIDDMAFQGLSNLTFLDLSNNQLTSEVMRPHVFRGQYAPDGYEPLREMKVLHLGYNAIHSLDQDLFEHLTFLSELSLKFNPLSVLDHPTVLAISSLDHLRVLDLSYTSIATLPENSLHSPRFLEELHLEGNHLSEVPSAALADTHALKVLNLDDNPIRVLDNVSFPALPFLQHLSVSLLPHLGRLEAGTFSGMRALEELVCAENERLEFISPEAFKGMVDNGDDYPLRRLHLNHNALGYLPKALLPRWDALEELSLESNPWVCDCEGQWMVSELMHLLDSMASPNLICHEPPEMKGQTLQELSQHEVHMRCLDLYGNQPERDGAILIGMLIGVLLAVPLTVAIVMLWRRFWPQLVGRHPPGAADYTRAFYKRADTISSEQA